jgi:hypothetical protein
LDPDPFAAFFLPFLLFRTVKEEDFFFPEEGEEDGEEEDALCPDPPPLLPVGVFFAPSPLSVFVVALFLGSLIAWQISVLLLFALRPGAIGKMISLSVSSSRDDDVALASARAPLRELTPTGSG